MPTQRPTLPVTCWILTFATPAAIGALVPSAGGAPGRVSNSRHGDTGTYVVSVSPGAAVTFHAWVAVVG